MNMHDWVPAKDESRGGEKWKNAKELNDKLLPLAVAPNFSKKYISTDSRGVLFTGCLYWAEDEVDLKDIHQEGSWEDMPVTEIIAKYGWTAKHDYDVRAGKYPSYGDGNFWPCVVTKPEGDESKDDNYTVRIVQSANEEPAFWETMGKPRIIIDVPRASIRHFYLPYKSDQHLSNAFRHYIDLRDDVFPEHWKNKRKMEQVGSVKKHAKK